VTNFFTEFDQAIAQTLAVSFDMIMGDALADGAAEHVFADEDHPVKAFRPQ